jgi:hypothetical protein
MRKAFVLVIILFTFTSATLEFKRTGAPLTQITGTYAASQVDTVKYVWEGTEHALNFYVHVRDSVSITNVIVHRVVDSKLRAVAAGDTIISAVVARQDTVISGAVTPTPPNEQLWFFVTYAGSAQGVTTPTLTYGLVKQR